MAHWWSVLLSWLVLLEWDAQDGIEALLPYIMPFLVTFAKKNKVGMLYVCCAIVPPRLPVALTQLIDFNQS